MDHSSPAACVCGEHRPTNQVMFTGSMAMPKREQMSVHAQDSPFLCMKAKAVSCFLLEF